MNFLFKQKKQLKQRVFLHIGTHKTGTTALQYFLYHNKDRLYTKRFHYPHIGWYHYAQHLLAFHLKEHNKLYDPSIWQELVDDIKKQPKKDIIISSEELFTISPKSIKLIAEYLADYEVHIVIYLRRQDQLFESIYNQQVKEWKSPRKEKIQLFLKKPEKIFPKFNYYYHLNVWIKNIPNAKFHVKIYEKDRLKNANIIDDFLEVLELKSNIFDHTSVILNDSLSPKALEIVRLSKHVISDITIREKIFHKAREVFPNSHKTVLLNNKERKNIMAKFKQSNQKLKEQFFSSEACLFSEIEDTEFVVENLNRQDLIKFIGEII